MKWKYIYTFLGKEYKGIVFADCWRDANDHILNELIHLAFLMDLKLLNHDIVNAMTTLNLISQNEEV